MGMEQVKQGHPMGKKNWKVGCPSLRLGKQSGGIQLSTMSQLWLALECLACHLLYPSLDGIKRLN